MAALIIQFDTNSIYIINRRMTNIKLSPDEYPPQTCPLCRPDNKQLKIMLKVIIKKLKIIYNQKHHQNMAFDDRLSKDRVSNIPRLFNLIFQKYKIQVSQAKGCPHLLLQQFFIRKLMCKEEQFQFFLNYLCDQIGKRNYELELLCLQIKNIENTASLIQIDQYQRKPSTEDEEGEFRKQKIGALQKIEMVEMIEPEVKVQAFEQSQQPLIDLKMQQISIQYQPTFFIWHGFYPQTQ